MRLAVHAQAQAGEGVDGLWIPQMDAVAAGHLKALNTPFLDLRRKLSLLLHRQKYRGALLDAFLDEL